MWINKDKKIHSKDSILVGFTYLDIINTANANGESVSKTFRNMIRESIARAYENFDDAHSDMKEMLKNMTEE